MVETKMNVKGQMKIQQMAFVLIAVTLFFVLVLMFVLVIQFSGLKNSAALVEEQNALLLASRLANSPEFSCGQAFKDSRVNCIDLDKVQALGQNIQTYNEFWGVEGISIQKIYPEQNTIAILDSGGEGIGVSNFVSLCSKSLSSESNSEIYNKCELGKIIVKYSVG